MTSLFFPLRTFLLSGILALLMLPSSPTVVSAQHTPLTKRIPNLPYVLRNRKMPEFQYPTTRRDAIQDDYHGTKISDPYRWLEDTESDETADWVKAQNKVTFDYLHRIETRQPIAERLTTLWNYERFGRPFKRGEYYFYSHNDGLQNQSVLYVLSLIHI